MTLVRPLRTADREELLALCARRPAHNLFVAARVLRHGMEKRTLGCDILGYFDGTRLISALHVGANLVPIEFPDAAVAGIFAANLGSWRTSNSLMGDADHVRWLYEALGRRWGRAWEGERDARWNQPLLLIDHDPWVAPDPRVEPVGPADFDAYFAASVAMYTEEVGVDPTAGGDAGYASHIRSLLREGRGFGIEEEGRIVFKSDVASPAGTLCQIQGVWLDPALRGRHLAAPAMAGVVSLARTRHPNVTLYVNDYNTPALGTYAKVGFRRIGTFATVLY